jgi:hypothetical protein
LPTKTHEGSAKAEPEKTEIDKAKTIPAKARLVFMILPYILYVTYLYKLFGSYFLLNSNKGGSNGLDD